jgi:hypothetical protein
VAGLLQADFQDSANIMNKERIANIKYGCGIACLGADSYQV